MESVGKIKKAIITFLILNFGLSSIFYYLTGSVGSVYAAGGFYVALLMYCPAIAAIITSLIFYRSISEFGWRPGKIKYLVIGYAIPLVYAIISYGIFWILSSGTYTGKFPQYNLIIWILYGTLTTIILGVLGEEIGWRGFLVPQLAKITSFSKVGLISGIIWAIWHFPLILFANYNAGTPLWYLLPMFTITVIAMSFILAWLRLRSGSIWPGVLLHASSNLFIQNLFDPLTKQIEITKYMVGETGVLMAVVIIIIAVISWMQRDKLPFTLIERSSKK